MVHLIGWLFFYRIYYVHIYWYGFSFMLFFNFKSIYTQNNCLNKEPHSTRLLFITISKHMFIVLFIRTKSSGERLKNTHWHVL